MLQRMSLLVLVLSCCLQGVAIKSARAAACCTSATAFGVGRLLMWEQFAVGTRTSVKSELASFDNDGALLFNEESLGELRTDFYALFALAKPTSIFVQLPWAVPWESDNEAVHWHSGVGDTQLGIRHQAIAIGEYAELPGVALMASILMPTGRAKTGASLATGSGSFGFFLGAALEKTFESIWFTQLNVGGRFPLPQRLPDNDSYWPGLGLDLGLVGGVEFAQNMVISLSSQFVADSEQYFNGIAKERSGRYKGSAAVALSWRFNPHWTASLSGSSDILIAGLGKYSAGVASAGVGIRYGYF